MKRPNRYDREEGCPEGAGKSTGSHISPNGVVEVLRRRLEWGIADEIRRHVEKKSGLRTLQTC